MVAARATVVGAAVTLAVLAATCVVAALAHKYISVREEREARDSFAASFADELVYARQLVSDRKYALHGMAEAYNALGAIPSPEIVARLARPFATLFPRMSGGFRLLQRVENTPSGRAAFEAAMRLRHNRTVIIRPTTWADVDASAGQATMWVIADGYPLNGRNMTMAGVDVSASADVRREIGELAAAHSMRAAPAPCETLLAGRQVSNGARSVDTLNLYSTVFPSDGVAYVLMATYSLKDYYAFVTNRSAHVTVGITDHSNATAMAPGAACELSDSVHTLKLQINMSSVAPWTVQIGQCPSFAKAWRRVDRELAVFFTVVAGLLLCWLVVYAVLLHKRSVMLRKIIRLHQESTAAHRWVMGYVCHELRNPLHILKSSVSCIVPATTVDVPVLKKTAALAHNDSCASMSGTAAFSVVSPLSDLMSASSASLLSSGAATSGSIDAVMLRAVAASPSDASCARNSLTLQPLADSLTLSASVKQSVRRPLVPAVPATPYSSSGVDAVVLRDMFDALERMEGTVNDVLDFRKLDSGLFRMDAKPTLLMDLISGVCRNCRSFLEPEVDLVIRVSAAAVSTVVADAVAMLDRRRVSQIITNGLSNAGKFTKRGTVTVEAALVDDVAVDAAPLPRRRIGRRLGRVKAEPLVDVGGAGASAASGCGRGNTVRYLVVTVSNDRTGEPISNPERLFVPFKGASSASGGGSTEGAGDGSRESSVPPDTAESWKPVSASPAHTQTMRQVWLRARSFVTQDEHAMVATVQPVRRADGTVAAAATANSTGLGLPLSRALARAAGGWLGLEDSSAVDCERSVKPQLGTSTADDVESGPSDESVQQRRQPQTLYWVVVRADAVPIELGVGESKPGSPSSAVNATASSPDTGAVVSVLPSEVYRVGMLPSAASVTAGTSTVSMVIPSAVSSAADPAHPHLPTVMEALAQSGSGRSVASAPPRTVDLTSFRVVFVDDEEANCRIGQRLCGRLGIPSSNIVVLHNGLDALRFIESGESASVMLLDIHMPQLTGLDVMARAVPRPPFPVLAMTGQVDLESIEQYRASGFTGCLCKPFDLEGLKSSLRKSQDGAWFSV